MAKKKTGTGKRTARLSDQRLVAMAQDLGAVGAKVISPKTVVTGPWVRWKCQFGCGGFGTSLVCPPYTPTPAETREMLDAYERAVLFEGSPDGPRPKEIAAALERELFLGGHYKAFGLGSGPCRLCEACTFEEGCRHPREARPAMEACGIDVFATARRHGFTIDVVRTRDETRRFFGLALVE